MSTYVIININKLKSYFEKYPGVNSKYMIGMAIIVYFKIFQAVVKK